VTRRPDPIASPQARRQAHQRALLEALAQRDALGVERLLGQWVHRQGHPALAALLLELQQVDPEGMAWWQGHAAQPEPALEPSPAPEQLRQPEPQPEHQHPERQPRVAQPNPELARLRSWLPDRVERRRAA
jgi:hypothetical protein